jgi:hypothetical protein
MKDLTDNHLPPGLIYGSIRQEILDQKKCQFQLFSMAVTVTAAILAYGEATDLGTHLYAAPMVLNLLALIIILEKAVSIQRKTGYLQMMEQGFEEGPWRWETHLDYFRSLRGVKWERSRRESRKHSYVTIVTLMLTVLNLLCAGLCWWDSNARTPERQKGWLDIVVLILLIAGPVWGFVKRQSLVSGENSTPAIIEKWHTVIREETKDNTSKSAR